MDLMQQVRLVEYDALLRMLLDLVLHVLVVPLEVLSRSTYSSSCSTVFTIQYLVYIRYM